MPDFTSALYLGLRHPSRSLRPWEQLSLGRPAALEEPPGASRVGAEVAALQGCEDGVLLPSTLHLFLDLFEVLGSVDTAIYWDAGSYPIARWGAERAALRGVPSHPFPHHDPVSLRRLLERTSGRKRRPVILADGFCPVCGGAAPLADYLEAARRRDGLLVIDDTQALGILGHQPGAASPYGQGGGGSLRLAGLTGPDVLVGASMAKGLGVPVASLSGAADLIGRITERSPSRVHCSPPSAAVIHAAVRALAINRGRGEALRLRLAERVRRFRSGLSRLGLAAQGGLFPVQTLEELPGLHPLRAHRLLLDRGIRGVPVRRRDVGGAGLAFLITARHGPDDIDRCLSALADILGGRARRGPPSSATSRAATRRSLACSETHHV